MLSRAATRVSPTLQLVARRGFSSTNALKTSPYHYPEGPRSNIPFNPLTKFFAVRYWSFVAVGFGAYSHLASRPLANLITGAPFLVALWQLKKNK